MKIKHIALTTALATSVLVASVAQAQVKFTGYYEETFQSGSAKNVSSALWTPNGGTGTANTSTADVGRGMTGEAQLRATSTATLPNGMIGEGMVEIRRSGGATPSVWEEREVRLSTADGSVVVGAGYDFQRGIEITRNYYPSVGNRAGDIIGTITGVIDPLDSTSSQHYIFADFPKLNVAGLGAGRLSFAYDPNSAHGSSTSLYNSDVNADKVTTKGQVRYSVGYTQNIGPVGIALGYLNGDQKMTNTTAALDPESKNIGIKYTGSNFAIGAQRFVNTNPVVGTAGTNEDKQTDFSVTFNPINELGVGFIRTKQEGTVAGVKDPDEIKQNLFQVAYTMGPIVISADYMKTDNAQYITGQDITVARAKIRANF